MQANMAITGMPQNVKVVLDYSQEVQSHATGFARHIKVGHLVRNQGKYNDKLNFHEAAGEQSEAVGTEIALALYMGVKNFVPTIDTYHDEPDLQVGNVSFEVKHTKYINGHLIIHKDYPRLDDIAVLLVGKSPVYEIAGWMPVKWCKQAKYRNAMDGNYWVAQRELFEIDTLRKSIYGITED